MTIGIANDHHGIELKQRIKKYLTKNNIKFINYGCDEKNNVDYIDYAKRLSYAVVNGSVDLGILICGTGIGMSIAANKIDGIRAAKVNTPREAQLAKEHNMANIMTLAEYTENLEEILDAFINTENSKEERHLRRVEKIKELE
jgi:ribose 5-phosphate isomerase B